MTSETLDQVEFTQEHVQCASWTVVAFGAPSDEALVCVFDPSLVMGPNSTYTLASLTPLVMTWDS